MRTDLQQLYNSVEQMDREQLLEQFRQLITSHDEALARISETEKAWHEMSIQFAQMRDRLSGSEKENILLKNENLRLTNQLNLRKKERFGQSSEKSEYLGQTDETFEDPTAEELSEEDVQRMEEQKRTRTDDTDPDHSKPDSDDSDNSGKGKHKAEKGRKKRDHSKLPVKTEFKIDFEALNREYGEGNWRIYGWEEHNQYVSIPCTVYRKRTYTPIISVGLEHKMVRIPYRDALLRGSLVSESLLAQIMHNKFALSLPLYRLEQDFERNGIQLSRQTMSNWIIRFSFDLFGPVYDRMMEVLRDSNYSQCDETVIKVIHDGRKAGAASYLWVHTSSELSGDHSVVVFCYELTRGTEHLREFYLRSGYRGFLTSDAYVSYDVLEKESEGDIVSTGCFMHCRRRFVQSILSLGRKNKKNEAFPEVKAKMLLDEIYNEDTPLKELSPEERLEKRNTLVRPKVDAFFDFVHSLDPENPSYSDRLRDAIKYSVNQEAKLRHFLDDPHIPCDNGHVERKIRPVAVGRCNWLFCNTISGAESLAIMYSMTETAKANGAHPYYYLKYLLEEMPKHMDDTDRSFLDDMMPWAEKYRRYETEQREEDVKFFTDQDSPVAPRTPRKRDRKGPPEVA